MNNDKNINCGTVGTSANKFVRRRAVLITGGTGGIGREIVRSFAAAGYAVAFCYYTAADEADKLVGELLRAEVNCLSLKCDVSSAEQVGHMRELAEQAFGFVDTIVNNAGIAHSKLFTDETPEDFDRVIGVNLKGAFNVCHAFVPKMINAGFGRIINVSSIWGIKGAALEVLYSASKAGLIGLSKALAAELAPCGITVNAIAPGMIDTKMNAEYSQSEVTEFLKNVPLSRIGTTQEIAAAALFLSENGYITGEVLNISGGL